LDPRELPAAVQRGKFSTCAPEDEELTGCPDFLLAHIFPIIAPAGRNVSIFVMTGRKKDTPKVRPISEKER